METTKTKSDEELMTPEELQAVMKLPSLNWVYQKVHTGTLPFNYVKIGHYLRFKRRDVLNYIERQTK